MRIGIDIRTLMDRHYSGVSEYSYNLIKNILALDHENEYRLFYNCLRRIDYRLPRFEEGKVEIIKSSYPNKVFNYLLQKLAHYPKLDKVLGGVDVFFSPHLNFMALSGATKKIITVHDLSFLRHPEFFSWRKNFWHYMLGVKKMLKKFDLVVAVSESTKNDLIELVGLPAEKIKVIYSGISNSFKTLNNLDLEEKKLHLQKKYDLPEKFILYLGNIEPRKNIRGIIRAYNNFRDEQPSSDLKLILAGATGWKIRDIFKELSQSPYKSDIKFLGYVAKEDKPALYNLAQFFLYPSFYEGFGFPPLEAMACGLPVITSAFSSLAEVAGGAALLVDPYNNEDITRAIIELSHNENLRQSLKAKGLERVKDFSWERTAKKYLALFQK